MEQDQHIGETSVSQHNRIVHSLQYKQASGTFFIREERSITAEQMPFILLHLKKTKSSIVHMESNSSLTDFSV